MEEWNIAAVNLIGILSLFMGVLYFLQLVILKKLNERSNRYILLYFGILTFIIFFFEAYDNGFEAISIQLIPLLNFSVLAIGPTVYLYIRSLTTDAKEVPFKKHYMAAMVVGMVSILLQLISLFGPNNELITNAYIYLTIGSMTLGFIVQNTYYIYQSLHIYQTHLKAIENIFSYEENVKLSWLRVLVYGYITFIASLILVSITDDDINDVFFDLIMLIYIVYTGFHAVKQTNIYQAIPQEVTVETKPEVLVDEKLEKIKDGLIVLMEKEKIHRDQDITIYELAEQLKTNSKYLSQTINRLLNRSFIVFINEYRVEEAKKFLSGNEHDNLTIEGIGQEAGFKSKSAFNTAFKKQTGVTPSAYKKTHSF